MGKKLSNDDFIKKSNILHKNFYNYIDEYKNSHSKIKIHCPIHGEFEQKPYSHLQGIGCPKCGFEKSSSKNRKKIEDFINLARYVHNNFYTYNKVEYKNNKENIKITCPKHGDFNQLPQHHLNGHGCPSCAPKKDNKSNFTFISQASKIHNNKYNYIEEYKGAHIPIEISCPKHGIFLQSPNSHLKGRGCPDCQWSNSSKMEKDWLDSLKIDRKYRNVFIKIKGKLYKFDAYVPETNTIYEFYGDFWHGNPNKFKEGENNKSKTSYSELYKRTIEREDFLKQNGFNLVTIWEDDYLKQIRKKII
jgi:G:T-mismatch repair DNA endonuclease (very short patch repair protein)